MDYGFGVCQNYNSFIKRACKSRGVRFRDYITDNGAYTHTSLDIYLGGISYNINTFVSWDEHCRTKEYESHYVSDISLLYKR